MVTLEKYSIIIFFSIFVGMLLFSKVILYFLEKSNNNLEEIEIESIKPIEFNILPTYIGLFVISMELNSFKKNETIFLLIGILLCIWILFEKSFYFNILWLVFGYNYYEITSKSNIQFIIISKKRDLKIIKEFKKLARINNFTFLEV